MYVTERSQKEVLNCRYMSNVTLCNEI